MKHLIKDCIPVASSETAGDDAETKTKGRRGHGTTSPLRTVSDTDVCLVLTCKTSASGLWVTSCWSWRSDCRCSLPLPSYWCWRSHLFFPLKSPQQSLPQHFQIFPRLSLLQKYFQSAYKSLKYHQMLFNCEIWARFDEPVAQCQSDDKQMLRLLSTVWQTLKGKENHLNSGPSQEDLAWILNFHKRTFAAPELLWHTGFDSLAQTSEWASVCGPAALTWFI